MSAISALTFLHIAVMFLAISLSLGPAVLLRVAARSGNARTIQGTAEATGRIGRVIGPIFGLGGLLGVATAVVTGYDLLAPWLLIAYVLFVVGATVGAVVEAGWTAAVAEAAAANPELIPGPPLVAILTSTRGAVSFWAFSGIVMLLILDMVVKPFS